MRHREVHKFDRIGWLRAAVLGANDGIVSTASLIVGVAAADANRDSILMSGMAGLVAGAMSMAAGEYVSVSSQADTERADLERERKELATDPEHEREELAQIYMTRGLDSDLAHRVADQMMARDALKAHARYKLGITEMVAARPLQAAFASALMFSVGAGLPLGFAFFAPIDSLVYSVSLASLIFLILLGMISAKAGGSQMGRAALRVGFWGAVAMAATALIGHLFGTVVG